MSDYILRQDAIDVIKDTTGFSFTEGELIRRICKVPALKLCSLNTVREAIEHSTDIRLKREPSKWIFIADDSVAFCERCGYMIDGKYCKSQGYMNPYKFCPNCGADMKGEDDERCNQQKESN